MRENIYYDWHRNRALNECHGCPYDQWTEMSDCSFAVHPKGFLVFLRPSQIAALDVACVDPTSVRRSANVAYHRRRFGVTLELLRCAGLAEKSAPKVLDVGCGGADITAEIHKAFPNAEIFALDCSILRHRVRGSDPSWHRVFSWRCVRPAVRRGLLRRCCV